ncbi:addiction module toxin [Streptococcus macacae NCTC 11558]|nr:type II toxin-antitoxin system YafQ family toxin [Streptococcus macacae]SUN78845.1 addiction module toxin [Streptococcus macacae NCTC 11558]
MRIERTSEFKRDYKRLLKKHRDVSKLRNVLELIISGETETLYRRYKNHFLKGQYKGYQECHIEADWLLIYKVEQKRLVLVLTRTGSHDELF